MRRAIFAALLAAGLLGVDAGWLTGQEIGVKLGTAINGMRLDDEPVTMRSIRSFAGGGFIRFGIGPLGFQPELLVTTRGTRSVDDGGAFFGRLSLQYIEVPMLVHLPLSAGLPLTPYVIGGPTFGFEIDCSAEAGATTFDCTDDASAAFRRRSSDVGITAGGGLATLAGPGILLVEGRYTWGRTNLNRVNGGTEVRNRGALLVAGFAVQLGGRH